MKAKSATFKALNANESVCDMTEKTMAAMPEVLQMLDVVDECDEA